MAEKRGLATWKPQELGEAPRPLGDSGGGAGLRTGTEASSALQMGSSNVVAARGASTVGARGSAVGWGAGVENRRISWIRAVLGGPEEVGPGVWGASSKQNIAVLSW